LEPPVLRGNRRAPHVVRNGRDPCAAYAAARQRLVKHDAIAIGDDRRCLRLNRRGRPPAGPDPEQQEPDQGLSSTTSVAVRPKTSGSYISSTCVGAVMNVPAVVARTTYVNSCTPSLSRVAKRLTRSSWRSTWSNPPCLHHAIQSLSCDSVFRC